MISLEDPEIEKIKMRRALIRLLIIEILGDDAARKVDCLADKLRDTFGDKKVKILRPSHMVDVKIFNLDESLLGVAVALAKVGDVREVNIRVDRIRCGFGVTTVRCPLSCAQRVAERSRHWNGHCSE